MYQDPVNTELCHYEILSCCYTTKFEMNLHIVKINNFCFDLEIVNTLMTRTGHVFKK